MEQTIRTRRVKLVAAVVVMLFAGIMYAWAIIKTPFEIFENGVLSNTAQLGINYTLTIIFFCLGGFGAGLISKQTTATLRFVLAAMLVFASFLISSFQIVTLPYSKNYFLLYMSYGMLGGLGAGLAFNTVISTVNEWFPDKRGFSSGVVLFGFALNSLIIGRVADILGRTDSIGWRSTYVIMAITLGAVFLAAAFVLKPPPPDTMFPKPKSVVGKDQALEIRNYTALEMIRRPSFILIFTYVAIMSASGHAAMSFAKDIVIDVGATEGFAVTVVGFLGLSNGLGRFTSGLLFDKLGIKQTQLISSAIIILAPVTVIMALISNSFVLCITGLCLCGFSLGFAPTTCSVFASGFYGPRDFSLNFSILSLILIPAPFAATLTGIVKTSTGEFTYAFIVLAILTVVGFFVNLAIRKP